MNIPNALNRLHPEVKAQAWNKFKELKSRNPAIMDEDLWDVALDVVRFNNRIDTLMILADMGVQQ